MITQEDRDAAREIVRKYYPEYVGVLSHTRRIEIAIECIKLGRERAAEIADNGGYLNLDFPYDRARQHIAQAIRALP